MARGRCDNLMLAERPRVTCNAASFITHLGAGTITWLLAGREQLPAIAPLIGFLWSAGQMLTLVTHILPWLFWCTSAAVSSLASADLLLLDTQKKWINDRAIEFWNWLDDQRELKYLPYLRKFRWQRFVAILYATVALAGVIMAAVIESSEYLDSAFTKSFTEGYTKAFLEGYSRSSGVEPVEITPTHVAHTTLGMFLGSFFAALLMAGPVLSRVLNWVTKTEGSWAYIGRSIPILIAALIAAIAAFVIVTFASIAGFFDKTPITAFIGWFWAMFVTTLAFAMVCSWVLVVVPVIFILLLMALFRAVQFVAVRVAENPKGPQYALSVLLAAVGAAISRFT